MTIDSNLSNDEHADALNPTVGAGTPDTAQWEQVKVPFLQRQPVLALVLVTLIPTAAAFVLEAASRTTEPLVLIGLGGISALIAGGGALVRANVTPTALPHDDTDRPLVPIALVPYQETDDEFQGRV